MLTHPARTSQSVRAARGFISPKRVDSPIYSYSPPPPGAGGGGGGGGGRTWGRPFDIALPVLAGELKAATLTPVGASAR